MTATFGKLQGQTLELRDGLNIIEAPNETGKSTWCAFLTAMLYGINSRERDRAGFIAEKNRYAPWAGTAMSGRLDCLSDGRELTITRTTRRQTAPMADFQAVYTGTASPVEGLTGANCGETLLGVSREVFERSAFIRQSGLAITQDAGLERRVASLISSGDEDTSYTEAYDALKKQLNRRRFNKSGQLPALEAELAEVQQQLDSSVQLQQQLADALERSQALESDVQALSDELAQYDRWEAAQKRRQLAALTTDADTAAQRVHSLTQQLEEDRVPDMETIGRLRGAIVNLETVRKNVEKARTDRDEAMKALFAYHIENARRFAKAKAIHQRIVTIDSHTDTPMIFPGEFNIGEKEGGKVNLSFMEEGRIDATFMVAYIPQGKRDEASLQAATAYAIERLNQVKRQQTLHPDRMVIATTPQEIRTIKAQGKKAICLGIENGYALGKQIENLRMFKEMGVSYITLCHNGDNDICDSARGKQEWKGLSPFGKEVVKEMNRLGIMVDISHAAESTFYQVMEVSETPIIASHSSARALCDHPRNLTDDQLKALAAQGGVAQICLYKGFINKEEDKASLSDAIRHINHIVDLIGIDHVGIGSDFDGDGELIGCSATNELINITVRLLEEGYTEEDIRKIWGGNLLRVMTAIQDFQNK